MAKTLPSAPEAEASLLGTMMVYPSAARTAIEEGLAEDDFFLDANRRIFQACLALYQEGDPIDLTTVSTRLKDTNLLDKTGGLNYLTELTNAAVTSANTKMYVNVIKDKALMRQMIDAAEKIAADGLDGQTDIDEYLDEAEKSILNVSRNRKAGNFKTSTELMTNVLNEISKMSENKSDITGLKTGLNDLDHMTHGLQRGDMLVLAARPSMGKTAVGLNLAMNVAAYQRKGAVAIFSLEMAAEQLAMRLLSAKSHVPADKLKTGRLSNDEWNQINEAAGELKSEQIYIDDASIVKVPEIFSKCRKLQAEHGLNLIMIDYIQLIAGSSRNSEANRQQEVSDISRSLKALARELQVPVLALSQLSRTVEQREKKQPMLSDLRESGAIEQDADIVMMLYRESYYDEAAKEKANQTGSERLEINLAKHRNGSTGKINVAFEAATNAIYNIENSQDYSQE
ncbi:MAG: replicative DNA helicase [Solobacterium sp.]|jgi:replicative DNA helicase|nr:replicative DNA helicase [Solobacterium sp.]MCH4204767.1 replicative DNA helicase [Solobacterium sp.]MCH4226391.1 replicative DNA helicase [Solobacterium sp.]MCH4282381.1 replicative DNA helicase [Solobacterium sp.]NLH63513.1 replicative DNA helicase [Erysipelotrichaceae bacterium]